MVFGVDISKEKVDMINAGVPPVVEPGLSDLLTDVIRAKQFTAMTSGMEAVHATDLGVLERPPRAAQASVSL